MKQQLVVIFKQFIIGTGPEFFEKLVFFFS